MPQPSNKHTATQGATLLSHPASSAGPLGNSCSAEQALGLSPLRASALPRSHSSAWAAGTMRTEMLVLRAHSLRHRVQVVRHHVAHVCSLQWGVKGGVCLVWYQWGVRILTLMVLTGAETTRPTESGQSFLVWLQLLGWILHINLVEIGLESRWT